jgi:MFS transporter, ACS family, D-galactonate transporter
VVGGLLLTSLLSLAGVPNAHSKAAFAAVFVAIGFVEGVCLVATPALIRDFSPQLGRASAMGSWTLGPVVGLLAVALVVSNSSDSTAWQDQYITCGIAGLAVWLVALAGLRELAPRLRDQLIVSARDRALIEARANGIDVQACTRKPFRQVFKPDIVGSAVAIALFLIIYYLAVGFLPVFFQTVFGFSQATASSLGKWFWTGQAIALLVTGLVSDRLGVRKPFMLAGAIGAVIATSLFALRATQPHTSYGTFAVLLTLVAVCLGIAYSPWMASFTETVERHNPAVTATGLAVWGLIMRTTVAVSVVLLPHVVTTVTTLVQDGPAVQAAVTGTDPALTTAQNATVKAVAADPRILTRAKALAATYAPELATAAKLSTATKAALAADPASKLAQSQALSQISGLPVTTVTRTITLGQTDASQLATARVIDPATRARLLAGPASTKAQATAAAEIAKAFGIAPAQAAARLAALASLPPSDLSFIAANAPEVRAAAGQLTALSHVPAADLAFLRQYGPQLQDPKVQASLAYLQAHAPAVKQALAASPRQWQNYLWVAAGGQLVFIPLIFLMAGFWDPRKARKHQRQHEAWVSAELAKPQPDLAATQQ